MQPGVTVVLATVWLAVYAAVVGTSTLHPYRLALDQYSPLAPRRHGVHRRVGGRPAWRDQNPAENQPHDLSIYPRWSITTGTESLEQSIDSKSYLERDLLFPRLGNSALDDFSSLAEDKQSRNSVGREFTDEKVDGRNTKGMELPSREQPPSELEDPFVADDTFQDQGPGSVEIYKLDLLREKPLLDPTPVTRLLTKNKSKTPKKTSHVSWKSKTTEYKATSPKVLYKQSNSFDDFSTGMPPINDPFSIGGVPELQVGCEGLEASNHKQKRSIDSGKKDKKAQDTVDYWVDITPVSLDMNYDSAVEDEYEEMDELVKIKKLENTTKNPKRRGDMDATHAGESSDDKKRAEKLPVRGDLGNSSVSNDSVVPSTMPVHGNRRANGGRMGDLHSDKAKREADAANLTANQGRKILWLNDAGVDERPVDKKRSKRGTWGFGEDEGVVSSDELQTETQRRRQYDNRRRQDEERRRQEQERRREEEAQRRDQIENRTNSDIGRIREEYERRLEQTQREEEERRGRLQQESQTTPANRWQLEEEYRRRVQEEEARRSRLQGEERRRQGEERRRQEVQASRGRFESRPRTSSTDDEEMERQRLWEEELKRRAEHRLREDERERVQGEEARRKEQLEREEEIKRRQQQELDRRSLEDRRREWMLKRSQDAEEERRREQSRHEPPANLLYPARASPNETRMYRVDEERRTREQTETEREQKLREYVRRNRPINVNGTADRQREAENWRRVEEDRRRVEEERKLQEYIRRNQPIHVPKGSGSYDRNWLEYRRTTDDARLNNRSSYPGPGNGRRNHGPSASTNIDPQNYVHEARRRDEEERARETQRMEALRREEEVRRMQSRRYEEQRRRQEAARLEAEKRAKEVTQEEARRSQAGRTRPRYEDRRRFEEHRRRQDTRLIPANLFLNESRRAEDLGRQRQEQERWRVEAERRRQQENRATEAREERTRAMKEQWRRQEEARLNALPVSARIIVRHGASSSPPVLVSRGGFDNDIDFTGINPTREGVPVPNFPVPPTERPPAKSPSPCVWAVVQCCPRKNIRLVTCFEATGCPGVNWDPSPCRVSIMQAAKEQVRKFYAEAEPDENL